MLFFERLLKYKLFRVMSKVSEHQRGYVKFARDPM